MPKTPTARPTPTASEEPTQTTSNLPTPENSQDTSSGSNECDNSKERRQAEDYTISTVDLLPALVKRRRGRPSKTPKTCKGNFGKVTGPLSKRRSGCGPEYHPGPNNRPSKSKRESARQQRARDRNPGEDTEVRCAERLSRLTVLSLHTIWCNKKSMAFYADTNPTPHIVPCSAFGIEPGYLGGSYVVNHNKRTYDARRDATQADEANDEYDDSTDVDEDIGTSAHCVIRLKGWHVGLCDLVGDYQDSKLEADVNAKDTPC
jgi:hypothetical protein